MDKFKFAFLRRPVRRTFFVWRTLFVCAFAAVILLPGRGQAQMPQIPQIPQIPAFLPTVDQVAATQSMPLDGTWLINTIRKKIRIEAGRAYAVDGWTHMFVLNIQPGMVVIKNIAPTGPGTYQAEDLPLLGTWTARVQRDRSLSISVATALAPVNYRLIPVQIDNPQWYAQEMQAVGLTPPAGAPPARPAYRFTQPGGGGAPPQQQPVTPPQQQPVQPAEPAEPEPAATASCETEQYDPKTDKMVCMNGKS